MGESMLKANDVARYFLAKSDPEIGELISHLKLQKLCYYAQGFHLALYGDPLFAESIEAWTHGPVVPAVWREYKDYRGEPIPAPADFDPSIYSDDEKELLDEVYSVYGQYSAWKLRNMTHEEAPWIAAHGAGGGVISRESMSEFFKTLLK